MTHKDAETLSLPGATLYHWPSFLADDTGQSYLAYLGAQMPWQQPVITLFGKRVASPRLTCWCADSGVSYRYSGLQHDGRGWDPRVRELRDRLVEKTGYRFNSCLLNFYRDGDDAMGWHSDDERELGEDPVIASISLGATRVFQLRARKPRNRQIRTTERVKSTRIPLVNGSLLLMSGSTQRHYKHQVARDRHVVEPRINLTFRQITREPCSRDVK